jgi:hypothetical protein
LSHHPQSEELIGDGVIRFEIRFLNGWDPNMKQPRCDFVVHRANGTAARLHPSSTKPGQIITGCLDDWVAPGHQRPSLLTRDTAGVAEHGQHIHGAAEHDAARTFRTVHQVDTVSRKSACAFLRERLEEWQKNDHPRGPFAVDLMLHPAGHTMSRDFKCAHYLNPTPWGQKIVLDVCEFHIIWLKHKKRPGFWIRLNDGSFGTLDVLGSDHCPIRWNDDADEVEWQ